MSVVGYLIGGLLVAAVWCAVGALHELLEASPEAKDEDDE